MIQRAGLAVLGVLFLAISAQGKLVITEIMYDPLSPESDPRVFRPAAPADRSESASHRFQVASSASP